MKSHRHSPSPASSFQYSGPKSWRDVEAIEASTDDEAKEEIRIFDDDDNEECDGIYMDNGYVDDRNSSGQKRSRRPTALAAAYLAQESPRDGLETEMLQGEDVKISGTENILIPQDGQVELYFSPRHNGEDHDKEHNSNDDIPANATFLVPSDIHPNMIDREDDIAKLRLLAGKLSADWRGQNVASPALARRLRDFQFAQEKRRRKYGDERPWGILGLYDHLAAVRVDVEWAEDAAYRRANGEAYLSWLDFDASKKRGANRPYFTYFLLITCTVILIASIIVNDWRVEPLSANPMIGPSTVSLIQMGAKYSDLIVNHHEAWRLVTSIVLHAGVVHYFINMLALWFVGSAIERTHGVLAAIILFVIPAIGGVILSAIFLPQYITVGASGGIFGLIGACLADIIMNWKLLFSDFVNENGKKHRHVMVVVFLIADIVLNCIIGLTPYVDNFTHLGGMTIGFLCGISTMERLSSDFFGIHQNCMTKTKQIIIRFFGLIVSIIGILIATIVLLEGDGATTPCPNCNLLSCVSFPPWNDYNNRWWYCDDCGGVTAQIMIQPTLHLDMKCPDGMNVQIDLGADTKIDKGDLEGRLPEYCRDFCKNIGL
mmetsp:Transcript_3503/g.5338  ORF Transcript_3503/g.5338 Transcript_3503/m.5338 type:complete len:601 (+) Transcript_3503:205-2007(+)|eukprot:CAMPEP_0194251854 /NCGR_PEP_ID=MMETSP0158-20130606/26320_1 /TAXON_ID=33649 /ORGANISM="Thalassionema nitzschioides, Strain L26-B" /LENGTH=600 /DNA_ID=CAMNT_0038989109 /DNA_START=130 /DNA_END=1932 /DNA_ORIENTATION=-